MEIPRTGKNSLLTRMPGAPKQRSRLPSSSRRLCDASHHGTAIFQLISNDMNDLFGTALQAARHYQETAAQNRAAEPGQHAGPDHDIGDAGFVFYRAEYDIAVAWSLTHQHD